MKSLFGIVFFVAATFSSTCFSAPITPIEAKSASSSIYLASPFYMIGIYEPNNEHGWKKDENGSYFLYRERGNATVYIEEQTSDDVVLSLGSYEPTDWTIKGPGADNVSKIIVHGYYDSTVKGQQSSAVVYDHTYKNNSSDYIKNVYKWDSPDREMIVETLEYIAGVPVTSFTGVYNAESFLIDAH